jgi:hypothetical protein
MKRKAFFFRTSSIRRSYCGLIWKRNADWRVISIIAGRLQLIADSPETAGPQADSRRMRENYGFLSASAPFGSSASRASFSLPGIANKEPTILFSVTQLVLTIC